jgi:hypothetical protein
MIKKIGKYFPEGISHGCGNVYNPMIIIIDKRQIEEEGSLSRHYQRDATAWYASIR